MKPIKIKDFKIGDWIILKSTTKDIKERGYERKYIIRIEEIDTYNKINEDEQNICERQKIRILYYSYGFKIDLRKKKYCNMEFYDWIVFNCYKTNRKEYKNEIMLSELEK